MKLRWREQNGQRGFAFAFGKAQRLWRDCLLLPLPLTRRVVITEDETDAIALIDAGIEGTLETLVMALPGASILPAGFEQRLVGRDVVLVFDNDIAGQRATALASERLRGFAATVRTVDWQKQKEAA